MLISASRALSGLMLRALFYAALFTAVVLVHAAVTGALSRQGLPGALAQTGSGAVVLGLVLLALGAADRIGEKRREALEAARVKYRMPGPCCVVWRDGEGENLSQWDLVGRLQARYPSILRRMGVEGVAVIDFEVSPEGRAKNLRCIHAWPTDTFYEAASDALLRARFEPKPDIHVRYGESYQLPFVFRLRGEASGWRGALRLPQLPGAAARTVDKLAQRREGDRQSVELS